MIMKNDTMKIIRWIGGAVLLGGIIGLILLRPLPFLFYMELPYLGFFGRAFYILISVSYTHLRAHET